MKNGKYDSKSRGAAGKRVAKSQNPNVGRRPGAAAPVKKTGAPEAVKKQNGLQIEGRNAVLEALRAGAGLTKLYLQEGSSGAEIEEIKALSERMGVIPQTVSSERLQSLQESRSPQGVVGRFREYRFFEVDEMLRDAREKGEDPFIVVLSGIEDPQNLGAIIRTACLMGAHGVVIRKDRAAGITPAVVKASAGALFRMKVAEVTNIAATLDKLKKEGLWALAADMDGKKPEELNLKGPIALVIGSEGEGVARLVREHSDFIVAIPMAKAGTVDSLNASVAAGILMYEIVRQRRL